MAETVPGRLWAYKIAAPGQVTAERRLLQGIAGFYMYDSLAVDAAGNVCVATLINGGISILVPDRCATRFIPFPIRSRRTSASAGPDLRTAYITASSVGDLLAMEWEGPGLPLNFLNR